MKSSKQFKLFLIKYSSHDVSDKPLPSRWIWVVGEVWTDLLGDTESGDKNLYFGKQSGIQGLQKKA